MASNQIKLVLNFDGERAARILEQARPRLNRLSRKKRKAERAKLVRRIVAECTSAAPA